MRLRVARRLGRDFKWALEVPVDELRIWMAEERLEAAQRAPTP